jgi:hypothetical protein
VYDFSYVDEANDLGDAVPSVITSDVSLRANTTTNDASFVAME